MQIDYEQKNQLLQLIAFEINSYICVIYRKYYTAMITQSEAVFGTLCCFARGGLG